MRPIYDALFDMMGQEQVLQLIEKQVIEIAPLAFMRGRTLSNAFVILDEAQNTTKTQMKMFLTRLGENSKMVANGDLSQTDLPRGTHSGLRDAMKILKDIKGVDVVNFTNTDSVRHELTSKIIEAYDAHESHQYDDKTLLD